VANTFGKLKASAFVYGTDHWNTTVADQARQNDNALCFREFDLGSSGPDGVDGTGTLDVDDLLRVVVPGADLQGFAARVRFFTKTDDAGTSATPRIYDETAAAALVTGSAVTATSYTEEAVTFTMPNATRKLKLQVTKSNGNALVYCAAKIELVVP
jgi:hypothetical protein